MSLRRTICGLAFGALLTACADESPVEAPVELDPSWPSVSEALGAHCGSLDCHGHRSRPLRLYHRLGLRLDPAEYPGSSLTTADEHTANHRAAIGLEPELTREVFAAGGSEPERLTLYRKALGLEQHKGEAVVQADSDADRCLRSWISGAADAQACTRARELVRP